MTEISDIVDGLLKRGKVTDENLEPVTVRIPKETSQRLDKLSKVLGESKAALMRMFLESATIEAENHLEKSQGAPRIRKEGSRNTRKHRSSSKAKTATGKGRHKIEDQSVVESDRGIYSEET